jgi:hypothetical protein
MIVRTTSYKYFALDTRSKGYGLDGKRKKSYEVMANQTSHKAAAVTSIEFPEDASLLNPTDTRHPSVQWDSGILKNSHRQESTDSNEAIGNQHPPTSYVEAASPTNPSMPAQASRSEDQNNVELHEGIYWPSPKAMGAFFLLGFTASLSHHFYYNHLDGEEVGGDHAQQWALRSELLFIDIPPSPLPI